MANSAPAGTGGLLLQDVDVPNSDIYSVPLNYWDPLGKDWVPIRHCNAGCKSISNCIVGGYIDDLQNRIQQIHCQEPHLTDRKELKAVLARLILQGKVCIVWGPKNTELLESKCSECSASDNVLFVYVNARQKTLAQGIVEAFDNIDKESDGSTWKIITESFFGVMDAASVLQLAQLGAATAAGAFVSGAVAVGSLHAAMDSLLPCRKLDSVDADVELLKGFLNLSKRLEKHPSLVNDELNLVLTGEENNQRLLTAICSM